MKIKKQLLISAALTFFASHSIAQSAFEGFYGQISTGYESNLIGSGSGLLSAPSTDEYYPLSSSSQQFGGAPLVLGFGYYFSIAPQWLIGIGADYSALSQTSSTFMSNMDASSVDSSGNKFTFTGNSVKLSNRINIFIAPSYEIDTNKLVYLKAGYSSIKAQLNGPTSYNTPDGNSPVSMSSPSTTVSGYIVGLGYKQMFADSFYGFAEANYMGYSKPSFSYTGLIYGYPTTNTLSTSLNSYQALIGVGYKF